jgi:Raf kinase inhibitor-like YbhB/YbcL family protein
MQLRSESFADGGPMPATFTCDGENISPRLAWQDVPEGANSFAILCSDPDAPAQRWYHWAIFDLPASSRYLPEGVLRTQSGVLRQGVNDFGNVGYDGPCPPRHSGLHSYLFSLLALAVERLPVRPAANCREVERIARRHCIDECLLIGTYGRD